MQILWPHLWAASQKLCGWRPAICWKSLWVTTEVWGPLLRGISFRLTPLLVSFYKWKQERQLMAIVFVKDPQCGYPELLNKSINILKIIWIGWDFFGERFRSLNRSLALINSPPITTGGLKKSEIEQGRSESFLLSLFLKVVVHELSHESHWECLLKCLSLTPDLINHTEEQEFFIYNSLYKITP